jgi:hypothetical protein
LKSLRSDKKSKRVSRKVIAVTKRLKTAERFATLSISLEIVSPEQVDDTEIELQEDLTEDLAEEEEGGGG